MSRYTGCTVSYQNTEHSFLFFYWLSAGSAGDWFSHGEEGDGAQTCNHSAEGEFLHLFFSDWPNKNCLVWWDEMLEHWLQKIEQKVCKKVRIVGVTGSFSASASEELLLRFCQCADLLLFTFTHTRHYPESESPFMPVCCWYFPVIEKDLRQSELFEVTGGGFWPWRISHLSVSSGRLDTERLDEPNRVWTCSHLTSGIPVCHLAQCICCDWGWD